MDIKRLARGPVLWILLALVLLLVATSVMSGLRGPQEVPTSQAVQAIQMPTDPASIRMLLALVGAGLHFQA